MATTRGNIDSVLESIADALGVGVAYANGARAKHLDLFINSNSPGDGKTRYELVQMIESTYASGARDEAGKYILTTGIGQESILCAIGAGAIYDALWSMLKGIRMQQNGGSAVHRRSTD